MLCTIYYPFAFAKEEEVIVALTDTALKIQGASDGRLLNSFSFEQLDSETLRTKNAKGNIVVYSLHGLGFHVFDASTGEETAVVEVGEKVKELRITPFNQIVLLPAQRKASIFSIYTLGLL